MIDAVKRGKLSRRAAAGHYEVSQSVAIKWLERLERHGSREPVGHGGHRASKLMPHREFLEAARAEKSDITLQALCDRLLAERRVKADTSMMSHFFRKIGVRMARPVCKGVFQDRQLISLLQRIQPRRVPFAQHPTCVAAEVGHVR